MSIKDLTYLAAIAEHKHFRKAAESCFVSQPTLSGQLKKFEAQLGVVLIDRSARQVKLTPVGELIVEQAQQVLSQYRQIDEIAKAHINPLSGPISLGLIPTISPYLLPRLLPEMSRHFSAINFRFVEDKTHVLLQQLQDGSLDLAIMANLPELEPYQLQDLYFEEFYLALSQQDAWASHTQMSLSRLNGQTMLMLADGHCLRDQAMTHCFAAGVNEDPSYQATSLETLASMIASGAGMTLMPKLACYTRPGIAYLSLTEQPQRQIVMVSRKGFARKALATRLADWIRSRAQAQGQTMHLTVPHTVPQIKNTTD